MPAASITFPSSAPTTQSEFDTRYSALLDAWQTALRNSCDYQLEVYPAMLKEAKLLRSVCRKSEGLRDMIQTIKWALA